MLCLIFWFVMPMIMCSILGITIPSSVIVVIVFLTLRFLLSPTTQMLQKCFFDLFAFLFFGWRNYFHTFLIFSLSSFQFFASDKGIVYSARAYKIPECTRAAAGTPLVQVFVVLNWKSILLDEGDLAYLLKDSKGREWGVS